MEAQGAETGWKCPPHWWIIDEKNVGRCKFCPEVKDMGRLSRKEARQMEIKSRVGGLRAHDYRKVKPPKYE